MHRTPKEIYNYLKTRKLNEEPVLTSLTNWYIDLSFWMPNGNEWTRGTVNDRIQNLIDLLDINYYRTNKNAIYDAYSNKSIVVGGDNGPGAKKIHYGRLPCHAIPILKKELLTLADEFAKYFTEEKIKQISPDLLEELRRVDQDIYDLVIQNLETAKTGLTAHNISH